jgi:hypothetical protein
MTDFAVTRRLRCRECKAKLPSPTANDNHAFCCAGCYRLFYRKRCVVCETERVRRLLCYRLECRSAYRGNRPKFTFPGQGSGSVKERASNADKTGTKNASALAWRAIAGPELTPTQLHCATVRDGGGFERIEARNRAALKAAGIPDLPLLGGRFTDPKWRKVVSPDGVRCFVARCEPRQAFQHSNWRPVSPRQPVADDLSIPAFLVRSPC